MKQVILAVVLVLGVTGCGMDPGTVAGPVPVKGRVTLANGQPVRDVVLTLQPMETGKQMAGLPVGPDGTFRGEAIAGKYTYFLSAQIGKTPAERQKYTTALNAVPAPFREPHAERTIKVGSGDLEIKLN